MSTHLRPVELTLVREKQTLLLMKAKSKLKRIEAMKHVYIDEACTPDELRKKSKLLKYAKSQKSIDSATSFQVIGKKVLELNTRSKSSKFQVNDEGNIVLWTEKPGSRQPWTIEGRPKGIWNAST